MTQTEEVVPKPSTASVSEIFSSYDSFPDSRIKGDMFSSYEDVRAKTTLIPKTPLKGATISHIWASGFATTSDLFQRYHQGRGDTNMVIPTWDVASEKSHGSRMYTCHAMVEGSPSPFLEAARFAMCKENDSGAKTRLVVHLSAQTPEVMFGTTFRVEAILEFVEESDDVVSVTITGGCKKIASRFSLIRSIADARATSDMRKGYNVFLGMLTDSLNIAKAEVKEVELPSVEVAAPPPKPSVVSMLPTEMSPTLLFAGAILMALVLLLVTFSSHSKEAYSPAGWNGGSEAPDAELVAILQALGVGNGAGGAGTQVPRSGNTNSVSSTAGSSGSGDVLQYRVTLLEGKVQALEAQLQWQSALLWGVLLICLGVGVAMKLRPGS